MKLDYDDKMLLWLSLFFLVFLLLSVFPPRSCSGNDCCCKRCCHCYDRGSGR